VLAVRFQNWKCFTSYNGETKCFTSYNGETMELYNLKKDTREQNNITSENKELANNLRDEMLEWFEKSDKSEVN